MVQTYRSVVNAALTIVILLLYLSTLAQSSSRCPLGYQIAYNEDGDIKCYRIKGPETFEDKFNDCAGNQYSMELLKSFNISITGHSLWTDYKNLYDGGPFVYWSEDGMINLLDSTYDVKIDSRYYVNDELCVIVDTVRNLTAVRCNELHHRYCIFDAYQEDDLDVHYSDVCANLTNPAPSRDEWHTFWFPSPKPSCLLKVKPQAGSKVRMNWTQAHNSCRDKGGSLLDQGWIYSNFPLFDTGKMIYPFGDKLSSKFTVPADHDNAIAKLNDCSETVNNTIKFYDVLCEKIIPPRKVNLTLMYNPGLAKVVLISNDTDLKKDDIRCFTDSTSYYPQRVKFNKPRRKKQMYELDYTFDGYYWCVHTDSINFTTSESNKFLWINKPLSEIEMLYAVNVTNSAHDYDLQNLNTELSNWKRKIEEYVTLANKVQSLKSPNGSQTIMSYKKSNPGLKVESIDMRLKRIFLNARSALLHVSLPAGLPPPGAGDYEDVHIKGMKPVYYCQLPAPLTARLALGEEHRVSECQIYKCTGDFNNGVELLITAEKSCPASPPPPPPLEAVTDLMLTVFTKLGHLHEEEDSSSEEDQVTANVTTEAYVPEFTTSTVNVVDNTESSEVIVVPTPFPTLRPPTRPPTVEPTTEAPELTPVVTVTPTFPPELITTPAPPSQQLEQVVQSLESILNNTDPVFVANITETFAQMDILMGDETEDLDFPSRLLHLLDDLGGRLDLDGESSVLTVKNNVALLVADNEPQRPIRGLRIAVRENDTFVEDAFEFLQDEVTDSQLVADDNEVVISLPESVGNSNRRVSFVVFRNDRAFRSTHQLFAVNSRVLSVNIENTTHFTNGEVIDIHMSPVLETVDRNVSRSCAYWDFLEDGSGGFWSQEGCTFLRATADGMLDTCRCNHLTHFAEVLVPRTLFSERNENILEVLSTVGCFMSILGLICVGVTALTFRAWRRDYSNKIWLQLCISIFILSIVFIIIIFAQFSEYNFVCMFTGIVLHFSVLSSFCWMLVAAVLSYRRLVTVFTRDASHKLLRASAFAWGLPCAVVGILLSVSPQAYSGRFDEKNPATKFCYPSGLALWLGVYGPLAAMLLVNWSLFALIVRSVFASRRNHPARVAHRHNNDRTEALRCASVSFFLVFLFGLPWLFGLLAMNVVMAYIFVILTTFQGFVLFLFFVLGNKKTRDLWLNKLKIKQTKKIPVTSSTYVNNRSTTANVNSRAANQPQTIEAKVSVPKSLNSQDNTRFS